MKNPLRRLFGEMDDDQSALRDDTKLVTSIIGEYSLRTNHVNYDLAKKLYRNEHNDYKLGAWAAKPVVNTAAGFMGAPRFLHATKDEVTQAHLDDGINAWSSKFLRMNRNSARDGDVFARIELRPERFDPNDVDFHVRLIPPAWVEPPVTDPLTGELREIIIKYPVQESERVGTRVVQKPKYHIVEILTPTTRELTVEGHAPIGTHDMLRARADMEADDNAWGFIPIVHFRNDAEEDELYGMSDLEPIEPFMRAYHDTFLYALQGAKSVARPKVQFRLGDVKTFLQRNFTEEQIRSGRLPYLDKELFLLQRDAAGEDTVEFITADTGLLGTSTLLEFLFYCIVDVSQTPEFAFGTAVASSKASVSEQMPVLARNIRRKRGEHEGYYQELASMYLAMQAQVGMAKPDTYRVETDWEETSPKDDSEIAATLEQIVGALVSAVDGGLMSLDAAVDFLAEFAPTMLPYSTEGSDADEKQRIIATAIMRRNLEAGDLSNIDQLEVARRTRSQITS